MTIIEGVCRLCGPSRFEEFLEKDGYRLARCHQCDLLQVIDDVRELDLSEVYDQDFFDDTYAQLQAEEGARKKELEKFDFRVREIEKLRPERGTMLDVGCSFGFFLEVARQRGWAVMGVEVGDYAAAYARDQLGLEVLTGDVAEVDLPEHHYDVITLWNVLEHLDDPAALARGFHRLLKPGGLFVFTTGNVDSYLRRLQGRRWRAFIPPIHLVNYSVKTVTKLLESTGFRVIKSSVALPREALLEKMGLIELLHRLRFSDKMMIFAEKTGEAGH